MGTKHKKWATIAHFLCFVSVGFAFRLSYTKSKVLEVRLCNGTVNVYQGVADK